MTRFKPPMLGTVFEHQYRSTMAMYIGRRRVFRSGRGIVTVYRLQGVVAYADERAPSYEVSREALTKNWSPVAVHISRVGSL